MNFNFATADEVTAELGRRLKAARLAQALQQTDLALRAGVSLGAVKTLENTGQSTMASFVRVVLALGMVDELQPLFVREVRSIADMEARAPSQRQRAPRKPRGPLARKAP